MTARLHDPDNLASEAEVPLPPPDSETHMSFGMPLARSRAARATVQRLGSLVRGERTALAGVVLLAVIGAIAAVIVPDLLGRATDVVVRGVSADTGIQRGQLARLLGAATAAVVLSSLAQYGVQHLLAGVVQRTMHRLRESVQEKLHSLPMPYLDSRPRGDLLSRVSNDVDNVGQSLQQTLGPLLSNVLTMMGIVVAMLLLSPLLFVVVVVSVPLGLLGLALLARIARGSYARQWRAVGRLNSHVEEALTGHAVLTAFGRQGDAVRRFEEDNDDHYRSSLGAQVVSGVMQPLMMLTGNLTFVALAVVGGLRAASGQLSIGTVQAFLQYSRQLTMPLMHMASMASVLQSGLASAERVLDLLDVPNEQPDAVPARALPAVRGLVCFEDVTFSYVPDRPLIEGLSLRAEPGMTVAIVGPTGAGKTTLVNLLLRFYDVDGGRITLDGHDIRALPRRELRRHFGMVLQETWLFQGTIRDNILYGAPQATAEQVTAAARAAHVDRFVATLPHGYDTVLDESASILSTGEKQLITIARAFLADPKILVLDEATSSVDTRTEVLVQHAMAALRSDRTSFVIAHRLSTIRNADMIVVMEHGNIVEQGDHASLLAAGGAYAELCAAQFSGVAGGEAHDA